MSNKPPHIYTAINQVMAALSLEGISKASENKQQGYKFRGIDDVYNALSKKMAEAKMCILPRVQGREITERQTKNGGVLSYVVVDVEFDFVSAEDGSKHTLKVLGEAMDSGDKATNKAMSAAYKYACMEAFCIPTEGDNDADATTHEVKPKTKPQTTRAKTAVGKDVREACADLGNIQDKNELEGLVGSKQWKALAAECRAEHPDMYQTMVATYQTTKARIETGAQNSPDDVEYVADQYIERLKTQMNADDCNTIAQEGIRALLAADADASIIKAVEDAMKARCAEIAGGAK